MLDEPSATALSELLPLMGCGEEAAVLGFEHLATRSGLDTASRIALHAIAADERVHDALLGGLRAALPRPGPHPAMRRAARRFHFALATGGAAMQLARITGVDSAVCTIVSRLLRKPGPLVCDRGVRSVLGKIRQDETQHVAVARKIAMALLEGSIARDAAAEARDGLADLLDFGTRAFEELGIDPDRLLRDVRALPNGLLTQ